MQMNDDFSTLNCFVSSLCWLHKYWRRSVFIYCNFVIVLQGEKKENQQQKKGLHKLSLPSDKLFHLLNPLIARAAGRGFGRKCFLSPKNNICQSLGLSVILRFQGLPLGGDYTPRILFDLNKLLNQMKVISCLCSASALTTEHIATNESTDGCYWNGLIIFMRSWKYHCVRWRRFWLCLLLLVLRNFAFILMSEL